MAKNRKKRRQELEAAGIAPPKRTAKVAKAAPVPVKEPEPVEPPRGPTPKKVKVKRPKYQRPPRVKFEPKPESKEDEKKGLTYSARTLRHSVARTIPKGGADEPDRPGWMPR